MRWIKDLHTKVELIIRYTWGRKNDPTFWQLVKQNVKKTLAHIYREVLVEGLIPRLRVYLKYARTSGCSVVVVGIFLYTLRSIIRPMLVIIHKHLGKIADFMDKSAYWLAKSYFVPYIGGILLSGFGLEVVTLILKNPQILHLVQQTIAQMSNAPKMVLQLLQSTELGYALLELLRSIHPTAWAKSLLQVVCYHHWWYQKSAAILAIGLRLPAFQTLGSIPEATLQLLRSIPARALGEGLVSFLWVERAWYQKPAMLASGLQITSLSLRGLMRLCILTHNKLYYPYSWLADPSRWLVTTIRSLFAWLSK